MFYKRTFSTIIREKPTTANKHSVSAEVCPMISSDLPAPFKHCFDDSLFVDFYDFLLQQHSDSLRQLEVGLDVNFYISKLNLFINQPLIRNVYVLDVAAATGRLISEILTVVGASRITKRLYFVGVENHQTVLSRARSNVNRQVRQGAGSNIDSLSINFATCPLTDLDIQSSPRRFHIVIVGNGSFHRLLSNEDRLKFFRSVTNVLLPTGLCIISLFSDFSFATEKEHVRVEARSSSAESPEHASGRHSSQLRQSLEQQIDRYHDDAKCFDLNMNSNCQPCSDDPTEQILSLFFFLQSKNNDSVLHTKSKSTMQLRSACLAKLIPFIEDAGLEVAEQFKSFRSALQRAGGGGDEATAAEYTQDTDGRVIVLRKRKK